MVGGGRCFPFDLGFDFDFFLVCLGFVLVLGFLGGVVVLFFFVCRGRRSFVGGFFFFFFSFLVRVIMVSRTRSLS